MKGKKGILALLALLLVGAAVAAVVIQLCCVRVGGKLLKKGIEVVRETMQPERILLEAQSYATGYYAREGFQVTSDEFLEDGIPHVWMTLDCR